MTTKPQTLNFIKKLNIILFLARIFASVQGISYLPEGSFPIPESYELQKLNFHFSAATSFHPKGCSCQKGSTNYDKIYKTNPITKRLKMNVSSLLLTTNDQRLATREAQNKPKQTQFSSSEAPPIKKAAENIPSSLSILHSKFYIFLSLRFFSNVAPPNPNSTSVIGSRTTARLYFQPRAREIKSLAVGTSLSSCLFKPHAVCEPSDLRARL